MGVGRVGLVCEPDVGVQVEIDEYAFGGGEERWSRFTESAGEHAGGVCDVRARLRGGVEKGADELLIAFADDGVGIVGLEELCVGDELRQVVGMRCLVAVDACGYTVGEEALDQFSDVGGLGGA